MFGMEETRVSGGVNMGGWYPLTTTYRDITRDQFPINFTDVSIIKIDGQTPLACFYRDSILNRLQRRP